MKIFMERFGKPFHPGESKRKKRKSIYGVVIFLVISLVVIGIATIIIESCIRRLAVSGQEETWAASVASYWGGIIGGVISGILGFLGVFYTIKYYKDSDDKKERAENQPFLLVEIGRDPEDRTGKGFSLGKQPESKGNQKTVYVAIKNIGHGFAKTLVIHTGFNIGGLEFSKVINVGDVVYTYFVVDKQRLQDGLSFAIQYIDSMTNEYIQNYMIQESGNIEIESGYPQFMRL